MKNRKKRHFGLTLLLALVLTASCSKDYDDDMLTNIMDSSPITEETGEVLATLGTIVRIEPTGTIVIEQDDGETVHVTNPNVLKALGTPQASDRYFYTYRRAAQSEQVVYIRIENAYKVTILSLQEEGTDNTSSDAADTAGFQPVSIIGQNLSNRYLNLQYQYKGSASGTPKHDFRLVALKEEPDDTGCLALELRHHTDDQQYEKTFVGYASALLAELPGYREGTLKKLSISYHSLDNKQETITLSLP